VNVGEDTTLGDSDVTQELIQLLIVANGKLQVTRDDTSLLVVTSGVTSQLKDFGSEILEDGSEVDRRTWPGQKTRVSNTVIIELTSTNTLSVVALTKQTVDTTNGEGKTRLGRTARNECQQSRNIFLFRLFNLRLRVLAATGLTAGLSSSHFWILRVGFLLNLGIGRDENDRSRVAAVDTESR
jgi:hypothetical protein